MATSTIYGTAQDWEPSNPSFRLSDTNEVEATFLMMKHDKDTGVTLKYMLECENDQCLVSDFITDTGDSFKQALIQCLKDTSK